MSIDDPGADDLGAASAVPPSYLPEPLPVHQHPASAEDMLLSIGDIAVYQSRVVTPSGTFEHQGLTWVARDNTTVSEGIPGYAIVLAIIFALACLLGLLFLLIKERRIQGYMEVSVQSPAGYHVTQIPISSPDQIALIRQQVDYCRSLVHYQ